MDGQNYKNILRIISENFELKEFDQDKNRSYFLRKLNFKFTFSGLLERLKITEPILIKESILGEIPYSLNVNDLLGTEFEICDCACTKMMPIKTIDLNAKNKYFIKQKLNLLFEFQLNVMFDEKDQFDSVIEFAHLIDGVKELECNPLNCLNQLNQALATIEIDEYCKYLRNLYYQDLFSLEMIHLKSRDIVSYNQNNRDDLQIIYETLDTAIQSRCYHKIFKSILHTNQISNSTLNDEICLFSTNWTYSKAIVKSLRDDIRSFIQLNQSNISNDQMVDNNLLTKKQLLTNLTECNDFVLFIDLDSGDAETKQQARKTIFSENGLNNDLIQNFLISRFMTKNDYLFEYYLNELNFLTIDLARDLLIYLINSIVEEVKSDLEPGDQEQSNGDDQAKSEPNEMPPIFQLLMHDNRKRSQETTTKYTINLYTDYQQSGNARFINQIKLKLQSFINQLYYRRLLKKHLLNLNHEPDVDIYINTIWTSICSIIKSLNHLDQSYLVEIFLANKRHLQSSSSFISRKYLYYIVRCLFEALYIVFSTIYDRFPIKLTINELQKNKFRLDNLIDQAFLIHLKDEVLIILADIDTSSIQIERPNLASNLNKFIKQKITRQNVTEILSQLITLIRLNLLQCSFYSSPLYTEFVMINEKFRKMDDSFEKQMNVNLFKVLNLDRKSSDIIKDPTKVITDIIENEILIRYLNLMPKFESLEQVAEIGAQIVLELGMKKNVG